MDYADRSLLGKRYYEMRETTLVARGSNMISKQYEAELRYADLDPVYERLWIRTPILTTGIWLCIGGAIGYVLVAQIQSLQHLVALFITFMVGGLLCLLLGVRRIELVRFKSKAGVGLLDVVKAGPRKSEFEEFVAALQARIKGAAGEKGA